MSKLSRFINHIKYKLTRPSTYTQIISAATVLSTLATNVGEPLRTECFVAAAVLNLVGVLLGKQNDSNNSSNS